MNTYIKQLLELIEESIEKISCSSENKLGSEIEFDQDFAQEYLQGKPEKISTIVGIDKYHFPSSDKVNEEQIDKLLLGIESLLLRYNLEFMFPENVTGPIKYQFILDQWNSKHVHCKQGIVQIETCKFDETNCPFPGQCNVCESFKYENDETHHLEKGLVDFSQLSPNFTDEDDKKLRGDVDKFKSIMKQPNNSNYIPGIHNYCDGRCEKCNYTDKCSSYTLNQELDKITDPRNIDTSSEEQLKVILKATSEIIEEELSKRGVNVESAMNEIQIDDCDDSPKHSIEKQAESYAEKVKRWIESNQIEMESRLVSESDSAIHESIETITWFQLFIPAKINRAVNGLRKDNVTDIDSFDAKGSAKIALIAIDECLDAWQHIMEYIPKKEDSILNLLSHLVKLKKELEVFIPDAREFARPGFDK